MTTPEHLNPPSITLSCPTYGCDAHLDFATRRNGGTPVRETCPSCGVHLTLQAGELRLAPR